MRILVTAASRHEATVAIAEEVARTIRQTLPEGVGVDVLPVEQVEALDGYDAVVLGSAVYIGHWLEPARRFVKTFTEQLSAMPVWLFSSGPIGQEPTADDTPGDAESLGRRIGARGHATFGGRLDKRELGVRERAVAAAVRAPEGDFRNWDSIHAWAEYVARDLQRTSVPHQR